MRGKKMATGGLGTKGRGGPTCSRRRNSGTCIPLHLYNGSYVGSGESDGLGLCPYDPQHNSTAVFAGGQLYAATVADFSGGEPLIHRQKIRTERSDLNQLNGPNFVSSFAYGDYVFFFYRETAVEYMNCGKAVYSRVARVCQHDKGGPHAFSDRWTTFLKARLNCSVPGEYPFYFNEIPRSVTRFYLPTIGELIFGKELRAESMSDPTTGFYAGRHDQLIYGIFTTPVNSISGSAVCAFSMSSVFDVFQGAFKEQETINSNWLRVLPEKVPEPRPGACVNDSRTLPDITVNFVKTHPLMDDAVQSFFTLPVLTKVSFNYRFTRVAVDPQVKALDGRTYDILYIGTDDGRVIKALNTKAPDSLAEVGQVIVSDVQVLRYGQAIKDLQVVHLAGEASKLVVIADSEIRAVPLHHCDSPAAVNSCVACVALQDPHCAWDATMDLCVAVPTKLHDNDASKTLFQDIITGKHKGCGAQQVNVDLDLAKPVPPVMPPRIGIGEQPDERDNEIVIELDRENQYSRTQPRANEPQGVTVTPVVYSAQTLTGALIGTCFFSLIAGFASGFWFSQRLRGAPYPDPPEQRQQLNRLTESSESPAGFNNKSINLVLNVTPKNPNGKNANSSAENKPMQKAATESENSYNNEHEHYGYECYDSASESKPPSSITTPIPRRNSLPPVSTVSCTSSEADLRHVSASHHQSFDPPSYDLIVNPEFLAERSSNHEDTLERSARIYSDTAAKSTRASTPVPRSKFTESLDHLDTTSGSLSYQRRRRGHPHQKLDQSKFKEGSREHYMVPTHEPNRPTSDSRTLSLFNPEFLPNFNDMLMYVARPELSDLSHVSFPWKHSQVGGIPYDDNNPEQTIPVDPSRGFGAGTPERESSYASLNTLQDRLNHVTGILESKIRLEGKDKNLYGTLSKRQQLLDSATKPAAVIKKGCNTIEYNC
ncbi:hypothetical protein KQX54_002362 [Cotesia glomerata]|uniref:Sema domain-containing protein n=1 Tax=Cotesia glomerata TaxID=32391 RepID=A0AAV7I6C6_COTGL|nr:hypothetical protein KQX54_002362 [Cotesia glomerata]